MATEDEKENAKYVVMTRRELEVKVAKLAAKLGKSAKIVTCGLGPSGVYVRATVQVEGEAKMRRFYYRFGWHSA